MCQGLLKEHHPFINAGDGFSGILIGGPCQWAVLAFALEMNTRAATSPDGLIFSESPVTRVGRAAGLTHHCSVMMSAGHAVTGG